jgi:hypothetical protein
VGATATARATIAVDNSEAKRCTRVIRSARGLNMAYPAKEERSADA